MKKIGLLNFTFLSGLLVLLFSSLMFLTGHYGIGEKFVIFSYFLLVIGLLRYFFLLINEN